MAATKINIDAPNNDDHDPTFVSRRYLRIGKHGDSIHVKFYYDDKSDAFTMKINTLNTMHQSEYKFKEWYAKNNIKHSGMPLDFIRSLQIDECIYDHNIKMITVVLKYLINESLISKRLDTYQTINETYTVKNNVYIEKPLYILKYTHPRVYMNIEPYKFCKIMLFMNNDAKMHIVLFDGLKLYQSNDILMSTSNKQYPMDKIYANLRELIANDKCNILGHLESATFEQLPNSILRMRYTLKIGVGYTLQCDFNTIDGRFI
jgi:hypothetical protein